MSVKSFSAAASWPPWVPLSVQGGEDGACRLLRNLSVLGFHARSRGAQWALGSAFGAFSEGAGFGEVAPRPLHPTLTTSTLQPLLVQWGFA